MSLKEQINSDLKTALLGGDHFKCDTLRTIKAAILNEEVAQGKRQEGLDDSSIEQLIAKELKKRRESAEIYVKAGRNELADDENKEAEILAEYLPAQLSEAEILDAINKQIDELKVDNPSAMGQLIGAVKKQLGNSADGSVIARLVKQALEEKINKTES